MNEYHPTAKLRWTLRTTALQNDLLPTYVKHILQQWWAPNVPAYMVVDPSQGEWRDVPVMSMSE